MLEQSTHTAVAQRIVDNVSKVIVGKRSVIEHALAALIAQGHILVEDVPGVGKTMLAKSLSISIGCNFKRIQFTPDLLPVMWLESRFTTRPPENFSFAQVP